jgi:hypothetical protein
MHDIDRTQIAYPGEMEMENFPMTSETPVLSEAQEMELASRLMELESEGEFENFLGDIISGVANAAGGIIGPGAGNALGGLLKGAAKKLLPIAGTIAGGYFGGPMGASLGGKLAGSLAGSLEMEAEEMEWETSKQFVRFAAEAAKNAALAPNADDGHIVAQQAVIDAAQKHAPELIAPATGRGPASGPSLEPEPPAFPASHQGQGGCGCHHRHHHHHHGGRWIRQGNQIILLGM